MKTKEIVRPPNNAAKCTSCNDEGIVRGVSDCCGARPRGNGDCDSQDFGVCGECKEHCNYDFPCPDCSEK